MMKRTDDDVQRIKKTQVLNKKRKFELERARKEEAFKKTREMVGER
jgi:hypothetical protein